MATITIKGAAKIVKIYNVTRMEIEGLDIEDVDLESKEDVKELFERVNEFVESAEVDAFEPPLVIEGVDPDDCCIKIDDTKCYSDEVTLKNYDITDLLAPIQNAQEGELFYIRSEEGDGLWDFESEGEIEDIASLSIGYLDCSIYFDQYDILREGYLDVICDTVLPRTISYNDMKIEFQELFFTPVQVYGQLYVVKIDPISETKILQKVDFGGRMLMDTDFIVDDFEEN